MVRVSANRLAQLASSTSSLSALSGRAGSRSQRLKAGSDGPFSLEYFLTKGKVLALYRGCIRSSKGLGDLKTRQETVKWFRDEIERNKHEKDLEKTKVLLALGHRQLKQIQSSGMLVGNEGDKFRGARAT